MSERLTPPIGVVGRFEVKSPFTVPQNRIYTVKAIRSAVELEMDYRNVYRDYYEPYDVSESVYQRDLENDVHIVTLIAKERSGSGNDIIHIPDTFIARFPNDDLVNYHRVILSLDMGILPEHVDLDHLKQSIAELSSDILGKLGKVELYLSEYEGVVTREEHDTQEASRQDNINAAETDRAKYLEQVRVNQALRRQLEVLTQVLIDNDLLET